MLHRSPLTLPLAFLPLLLACEGSPDPSAGGGNAPPPGSGDDIPGQFDRIADPVVLLGTDLPGLSSALADDVIAFARSEGRWVQVPVQVDERAVVDFCEVYGKSSGLWNSSPACKTDEVVTTSMYTDTTTFTGADPDPTLDADDELVFMGRDAGDRVGAWTTPSGARAGSGVEVAVEDGENTAYLYLFEREDPSLDPGAGARYVEYDFVLEGGVDYLSGYDLYGVSCGGDTAVCNPSMLEDSTIEGANYSRHFSGRWLADGLRITEGDASGVDILDVTQMRFSPDSCGRHVLTYSTAEGAFITNKSGPVRAIRAYLGANSGPLTERVHHFYDRREDILVSLRVHPLAGGVMDLFDYSPESEGMTYYNDLNLQGLRIDGVPDEANEEGVPTWEFLTGAQGSLLMLLETERSFEVDEMRFFWADDIAPSFHQCNTSTELSVPDESAFGTSGLWIRGSLPETDPKRGGTDYMTSQRTLYFREPGLSLGDAQAFIESARSEPRVSARTIDEDGLGAACGDGTCESGEEATCAVDCVPVDGSCGDGLCLRPETSTSCPGDCPAENEGAEVCGNGTCTGVENELSCPEDCFPQVTQTIACVDMSCPSLLGACEDEPGCVAFVTCTAQCVTSGDESSACFTDCNDTLDLSSIDYDVGSGLWLCADASGCL